MCPGQFGCVAYLLVPCHDSIRLRIRKALKAKSELVLANHTASQGSENDGRLHLFEAQVELSLGKAIDSLDAFGLSL